MKAFTKLVLTGVVAGFAPGTIAATPEATGTTTAGAAWRIAVPPGWQPGDGLVMVQHGFAFDPVTDPSLGPLRDRLLGDGYAVAASGYRQRGWALFSAPDDNADLLAIFEERHGRPGHLVLAGGSMGGLVSLKLAEDPRLAARTAGVLAYCPAADGAAAWDSAFDLRLAYDAICSGADGGDLPRGAEPTPWALDLDQLPASVSAPEDSAGLLSSAAGIARCTGLGIPAPLRTGGMAQRLDRLMTVAGTRDEEALLQQLAYAVVGLSDLVRSPDKLAGAVPFFNAAHGARVEYGAGIDAVVRRVERDPLARLAFHRTSTLEGTGVARIVSLHTAGDAVTPLWHQQSILFRYAPRAPLFGVVNNDRATHCDFTPAEVAAGWDTLRDWIANGERPTVATLDAHCRAAAAGDCRFDPASDERVRQASPFRRTTLTDILDTGFETVGGLWSTPGLPSQGLMIEELDQPLGSAPMGEQRFAVTFYTWSPQGDPAPGPRWYAGLGRSVERTLYVDRLDEVRGGAFATALDPARLQFVRWGGAVLDFSPAPARMQFDGARGARWLSQVTRSGLGLPPSLELDPPPREHFARAGTYTLAAHPGQGWVLNQYGNGAGGVASLLLWYTHDAAGRPSWMHGLDADDRDGLRFAMTRAVRGGTFESGASPTSPNQEPFGTVTLETDACDVVAVQWEPIVPAFPAGRLPVVRLTAPWLRHDFEGCRR